MRRYIEWEWYQRQVKKMQEQHPDVYMPTEGIPFADVRENVKGKWRYQYKLDDVYDIKGGRSWAIVRSCDKCDFTHVFVNNHIGQYNFCPNCGADMRGDNNDT